MYNGMITEENHAAITKMLVEAMQEMALSRNDSIESPVSLSLFLLEMGVDDPTVEDKLVKKTVDMVFSAEDAMKLTTQDFQKEFAKISPLIADEGSVKYIVRWIGMYFVPKVYPVFFNLL